MAAGSHPDFIRLELEARDKGGGLRREIKVDQARRLPEFFSKAPALGRCRVAIIDSVDDLNTNAANAVLKTLEEPSASGVLLLISHAPGRLLPTIRSRCRRLRFDAWPEPAIATFLSERGLDPGLAGLAAGSPGRALALAEAGASDLQPQAEALIDAEGPNRLEAFQVASGKRLARLEERTEAAAVNADGTVVAVCLSDSVGVWAPAAGTLHRSPGLRAVVTALSPDGQVAAFGDERGQVRIWRSVPNETENLPADAGAIRALTFGGEGRTLFVANGSGLLQAWHLGTRQELFSRGLAHPAEWLVMAPNDAGLLVGYPAPAGEETGSNWWWPVAAAERLRPSPSPALPLPTPDHLPIWLKPRRGK